MNRFLRFTALLISLATILLSPTKLYALSYTANFTDLGDHPGAVVQQTDVGRTINNLTLFNNKIYASYGDYGANTGPIQLIPYNISTNTYEPSEFTLATEATQIMRVFGGKLYVPVVDGDGCGSCTPTTAVYDGSTWSLIQVAGSTAELVRGIAKGFGSLDEVSSPSFAITNVYTNVNENSIYHFDFYRLGKNIGIIANQLSEALDNPEVVVVTEWSGELSDFLPANRLSIIFSKMDDENSRRIILKVNDVLTQKFIRVFS